MTDASTALVRAVRRGLGTVSEFAPEEVRSRCWTSVAFAGVRHLLRFRIAGEEVEEAADALRRAIDDGALALRGHFLAEAAIVSAAPIAGGGAMRITIEALTVEDPQSTES